MSTRPLFDAPVALVSAAGAGDPFVGVDAALVARGLGATRYECADTPPCFDERTKAVVVADTESFLCRRALREARAVGAATILLMDGIVEFRNTFRNPRNHESFLRPAPVDAIAAAGEIDAARLGALGNRRVAATGLPRLASSREVARSAERGDGSRRLLITTARTPWFNTRERDQLIMAYRALKDAIARRERLEAIWRLPTELAEALEVDADDRSLDELLPRLHGAITTASTLLVELMAAGTPTALAHPFDAPVWTPAPLIWRPRVRHADIRDADELLDRILKPDPAREARQDRILAQLARFDPPPSDGVADLILEMIETRERGTTLIPDARRLPTPRTRERGRRRAVNLVHLDETPVGGVTVWADRLSRAVNRASSTDWDLITLYITPQPLNRFALEEELARGDATLCVYDPTDDHALILDHLANAIERLEPDLILPNYGDMLHAAASLVKARHGVALVAIAHTDDDYYRTLLQTYDAWDASVAVSKACAAWLAPMSGDRPMERIVYGVPASGRRTPRSNDDPLQLAYIGRVAQAQKRVFDLFPLLDRLDERGITFEFHLVGDGPDADAWSRENDRRRWRTGRVRWHGQRSVDWVQRFLQRVDVSVLVSEAEGASISMLEAMGAGVVPAVTAVSSGVDEWIEPGVTGVLAPVGKPRELADEIVRLAEDRGALETISRAAHERVRDKLSVDTMAHRYLALFDRALDRRRRTPNAARSLRLIERWRWQKSWVDEPDRVDAILDVAWRDLGGEGPRDRTKIDRSLLVAPDRASGESFRGGALDRVRAALEALEARGRSRIVLYGVGRHTRRAAPALLHRPSVVGFIDDHPPSDGVAYGRPVASVEEALERFRPDAVLISSDGWETALYDRTTPLRDAGVEIVTLYHEPEGHPAIARAEVGVV
ncbi:MAG: glycosyltransferase [Phycisphaerales bacterium]